ncbi:MAG TPA: hypothetical protein VNG53_06780, partial [Bacteroidia bacterium]|nr:hypothetical protein [Bacteroidia bacterium]
MKNSYRTQKSHQKAKSLKGKTIGLLTAIFLMCSLYGYSQTTPPIIAWQYTNTPQFTSTTDLLPSPDYGENWFYNITPTSDGGYLGVGYAEIYPNTGGGVVTQPILVKIDQFGHLVWEQVYDGGKPSDPGFFWQAVESKDAITGQPVYVAMASKSGNDGNGSNYGNIFIVEVDPSNGKIKDNTAGAYPNGYYYGSIFIDGNNSNGSGNITMSSTPIYLANTDVSRSSIETVDYGSGQNGYIITGTQRDYDTNDGSDIKSNAVFLLKLNNDFTFDNTFGAPLSTSSSTPKTGFQLYPYSYPHLAGTAYSPSIAREMTILNNGTPNIQYVVTGWVGSAYTASHGDDIFLVSTDGTGVFQWNQTYTHQQLVDDGYVKDNRVETNAFNAGNPNAYGGENPPANPNDWGMNLVWNQTSNKLYMNAECDLYYGYSNSGGSFYSQVYDTPPATGSNKSPNHADSFLSFSDAILTIDPTNGNLQALTNVAPFDGVDFFPMLINTPDGGLAVAGNKSYTAPGFPDPLTSAELCGCNSLLAYNTLSKTVLGENIDIVKFDASMNKQWEQQYLQSQGTNASAPPNASVNCQWGFAVTQDGGFILGGNNELNDEDYSAMKLVYPSCPNTAISQIPATSVNDLLDLMITTNTTWNSPMYIEGVVDVQPGATLTITGTGTNIQFANKAETGITSKIVVERGAHLIVQNNAVLEGIPSCVSSMWGGIEVWGRSNVPQSLNDTSTGTVTIESGATISDMDLHGITTIRNNSEDEQNWAYTGGVVKANNANFIDNDRAAAFLYYHNTPNSNSNLSEFTDCNFTTSNAPPTGFKFNSFVTMYEVHGIYFKGNTFKNLSAYTSSD